MNRALDVPAGAPVATGTGGHLAALCCVAWWQGMIGVLAKVIEVPAVPLVVGRCAVAAVCLLALARITRRRVGRSRRAVVGTLITGVLLAAHWATLFMAYQMTEVALVVIGVFTFPVMAALSEPWFFGARPGWRQVSAAILVVVGVAVLKPVDADAAATTGLALALVSAACFCARNILSRKLLTDAGARADAIPLMGWQALVAVVVLSPSLVDPALLEVGWVDLAMVGVLGLFFTAIPHTIAVHVMSRLSAATSGIVGSQQVIVGIILAWLILDEAITWRVGAGAGLVLTAVTWESLGKWREGRRLAAEVAEAE